ncbi:MAG: endonuclease/exonuclease/phosphatase family protein [Acidobacteriota bacterium]|jgi:endonuclease/exonuclease/phosphatase family metal-dependent hydrolase
MIRTRGDGLVLVTYNVRRCIGTDGREDPGRVAEVLREIRPDVAALQEVDSEVEGGSPDQLAMLSEATGMTAIAGPTLRRGDTGYGNALLVRHPPGAVRRHDLSVDDNAEPRGALEVDLPYPGPPLRLVATHLGLRAQERRRQASKLIVLLGDRPSPVALLGDLNEWLPWGPVRRLLRANGFGGGTVRSFPSRIPALPLDGIWSRPASLLGVASVHRSRLARRASDHLPVKAILRRPDALDAAAGTGGRLQGGSAGRT